MRTLRQIINEEPDHSVITDEQLTESLVGKGFAIGQNRQFQSLKTQAVSKLGQIQTDCKRGIQEDDEIKRDKILFEVIYDLASVLKVFAEMSSKTNNISTTSVLDQENIKKILNAFLSKLTGKK